MAIVLLPYLLSSLTLGCVLRARGVDEPAHLWAILTVVSKVLVPTLIFAALGALVLSRMTLVADARGVRWARRFVLPWGDIRSVTTRDSRGPRCLRRVHIDRGGWMPWHLYYRMPGCPDFLARIAAFAPADNPLRAYSALSSCAPRTGSEAASGARPGASGRIVSKSDDT